MYFAIVDSDGSTVESLTDERAAEHRLLELATSARASDVYLLLAYTDEGAPVGDARLASDVLSRAALTPTPVVESLSIKIESGAFLGRLATPRVNIGPLQVTSPEVVPATA